MQEINKNIMTIKIIIPYQQWMKYGRNECRGCRRNEYGDIYFVVDESFFLFVRWTDYPNASFSYIVNTMRGADKDNAMRGDISFYFDFESRYLFHDRKLKERAIILCLNASPISVKLRDRISSFSNTVVLTPSILLIEYCETNGHMVLLGKIKRISELLMVEKKQEYMNDMSDILVRDTFAMCSDIQVKDDSLVYFASSPFNTPIVTIW